MKIIVTLGVAAMMGLPSDAAEVTSLQEVLELAYQNSPSISASQKMLEAEELLVGSEATLDDPMIGISNLDRNARTLYATVSQKIKFPLKYFFQAKMQSARAEAFRALLDLEKLNVREQVVSLYFSIYSAQKIIQLTKANMESVKEFARVAEKKYAAGKSPQSDSMKAHFELTQLELELIGLKQEEDAIQERLTATVSAKDLNRLDFANKVIKIPYYIPGNLTESMPELSSKVQKHSSKIKIQSQRFKEAEYQFQLATWEFAPDFQLQYQHRISGVPEDSRIYSIAMTFPLWFWKKNSEVSGASSRKTAQEFKLTDTLQKTVAKIRDLKGKTETGLKVLNVYETSLIPQAQGAFSSTRAAYRANKTSFLDLLESERTLYRVKTGFYRALKQYVISLSQLETLLGFTVSDFDTKNGVQK